MKTIDGKCYLKMLLGGAALLSAHTEEINSLNVFPVCDGDTGTNMSKTIEGGLSAANINNMESIGEMMNAFSKGILLSARGNSGVILSRIFAGIKEKLEGKDLVNALGLAEAYRNGIEKSYSSVQNPTEGTILTVFRESTEYAAKNIDENSDIEDFFKFHIEEAKRSLSETPDLLPVLKKADVVDSGGAGYLYLSEGMYETLLGKPLDTEYKFSGTKEKSNINIDSFKRDSVLEFGYCTEFLLRLMDAKVEPETIKAENIISELTAMGGESVVAYKDDDIIKVHVHTFTPGNILAKMQEYGEFLTVKIENMSLSHSEEETEKKRFSVVSVTSGEGISALFSSMGADYIINGGQSTNPSVEDFTEAFRRLRSEHIIVLPNNKNVILAAKGAAEIFEGAEVHVVETKNMMQGYSALSVINPAVDDIADIISSAERAAEGVEEGEITLAVRDAEMDGFKIKKGDYIGIKKGCISAKSETAEEAVIRLLETMDTELCEIITLFAGENVTEERRANLTEQLEELYPDCEITVYNGGQPVYDYYISAE